MTEVLWDAGLDCLKVMPFLFAAFLMVEALEHYSEGIVQRILTKVGKGAPVVGAVAGCVPQCGFSAMASNLYAGGVISVGTLLSVFLATSDEAILIIMGNPGYGREILWILVTKVIIAVVAGYSTDALFGRRISTRKEPGSFCHRCGCAKKKSIVKSAFYHTLKIAAYLFVFTAILNGIIALFGTERISAVLLSDSMFQPVAAALIGLIPNCAASVMLTQLYLTDVLSFASVISGLCSGAGIGLVVLFKMNHNKKENVKILLTLFLIAVFVGMVLTMLDR